MRACATPGARDDLTAEAVSAAFERPLALDADALAQVAARYAAMGRPMGEVLSELQAAGATFQDDDDGGEAMRREGIFPLDDPSSAARGLAQRDDAPPRGQQPLPQQRARCCCCCC